MWWKNVKLMVLLGVVVVFLLYLVVGSVCGLPGEFTSLLNGMDVILTLVGWSRCAGSSKD